MLDNSITEQQLYSQLVDAIKYANTNSFDLAFNRGKIAKRHFFVKLTDFLKRQVQKKIRLIVFNFKCKSIKKMPIVGTINTEYRRVQQSNYFSPYRIAVYTVIFGKYDNVYEPKVVPDNCDFYIITDIDSKELEKSVWTKMKLDELGVHIQNLSDIEKNRYFKMKPHLLFPNYDYSIYVDGNVQIMTDLTEFIHDMAYSGISVHKHRERDCLYEEAKEVLKLNREKLPNIIKHINYITSTNMPKNYGLYECGVLVREHNLEICKKIMDEWWNDFENYSKRDQISFAHVLYKNNIDRDGLCILGDNIYYNNAFRIFLH